MKVILFFIRNARSRLLIAVATGIISGLSSMVLLALFTNVLKSGSRYPRFSLIYILLGLCLFLPLTRFVSEVLLLRLAQGELYSLRMQLSRRILKAALRHLEILGPEPFMATFTDDIPGIVDALHLLPALCLNMAIAIGGFVYLGSLSWRVLLLVLGFFMLGLLAYEVPSNWSVRCFRAARKELDALWGHFRDLIAGVKELKLHSQRRQVFLSQVLRGTAAARNEHLVKAFQFHGIANSLGQMLVFVAIGVILFSPVAGHSGMAGPAGSIMTLLYITSALQFVLNGLPAISKAGIALERLDGLTRQLEGPGVLESEEDITVDGNFGCQRLTLKSITHSYYNQQAKEAFTLGPISMNLKAGELVVVAGGNGSGKTTLAKIITGLYPAESGDLLLDGRRVTAENREFYRQHFSAVFYDFHLFETLLGLEKPDLDENARERLARLQLNHVVSIKNGVLSTTQLSQGQRKRLALLTASLEDRPIYVFDEWAADQDPEFKEFFYRDLLSDLKAKGKLVLIICHDDHYFDVADRMIKLESGKIIYDGVPVAS